MSTFILLGMIAVNFVKAQENTPETKKSNSTAFESQTSDETLNILLKVPGVQAQYEACKKAGAELKELSDCIWNGYEKGDTPQVPKLKDEIKTKVQEAYAKLQTVKKNENEEKRDLTLNSTNIVNSYVNDPGYLKLSQIIEGKLKEAMQGSMKDENKLVAIDHSRFNELYKSQVAKNIIDSLTAYCVRVNSSPVTSTSCKAEQEVLCKYKKSKDEKCNNIDHSCEFYTFKDNDEDNIKNNLKYISEDSPPKININHCIASVPIACSTKPSEIEEPKNEKHSKKAQQMACTVDNYLRASRKNLMIAEDISKFYESLGSGNSSGQVEISNLDHPKDFDKARAINITSKEVDEAFKSESEKLTKLAEDCEKNPTNNACKQLLDVNKDEKEKSLAEFGLRQQVQEESLQKMINDKNTKGLEDYLKAEGFDEKQVAGMVKDESQLSNIKQLIRDKFTTQKEALITELSDRIENSTSKKNGTLSVDDRFENIKTKLEGKSDELKKIIRFNNIAAAYLEVTTNEKEKNAGRNPSNTKSKNNTAALREELKADPNNPENENLKKTFSNTESDNDTGASIKLDDLRDIIGF